MFSNEELQNHSIMLQVYREKYENMYNKNYIGIVFNCINLFIYPLAHIFQDLD